MKGIVVRFVALALVLGSTTAFLTACDGTPISSTSLAPATAKGDTPVRFIVCMYGDVNCRVMARFDGLGSCEVHKDFANTNCDFDTTPGKIICIKDKGRAERTVFYCLP